MSIFNLIPLFLQTLRNILFDFKVKIRKCNYLYLLRKLEIWREALATLASSFAIAL